MRFTDRWKLLMRDGGMGLAAARAAARLDCLRAAQVGMVPLDTVRGTIASAMVMLANRGAPISAVAHYENIISAWPDTACSRVTVEYVTRTRDSHTNTHPGLYIRVKIHSLDYPWDMVAEAKVLSPFKTTVAMGPTIRVRGMVKAAEDTSRIVHRTIYLAEL